MSASSNRGDISQVGAACANVAWLLTQVADILPPAQGRPSAEAATSSGFSLRDGVAAEAAERDKLEHLARYVARQPIATERLALTDSGHIRYTLETPCRDGTTHLM